MAQKKKATKKLKVNFFKKISNKLPATKPKLVFGGMVLIVLLSTVIYSANYAWQYHQANNMYKEAHAGWSGPFNLPNDLVVFLCKTPPNQGGSKVHAMVGKVTSNYRSVQMLTQPSSFGVDGMYFNQFFNLGIYGYWGFTPWSVDLPLYGGNVFFNTSPSPSSGTTTSAKFYASSLNNC